MEKLYTPQEVADYLGFSINTVVRYITIGKIKTVKVLGSNRVTETELKAMVKERKVKN